MKKRVYLIVAVLILTSVSCEEILMEDDISGETVRLTAPVDDAQFFSTGITFTWEPIEYGTQYRIQIARPNFDAPLQIVADNIVDTTSFTTQLNVGDYQWRVQGINSSYHTSYTTRSFTIVSNEDFQSNSVTLTSPANNIITNDISQNLVWQPVIGATSYQVVIVDTEDSSIVSDETTTNTEYSYTFADGNFQWKVRASNNEQNTLYSSRSLLVDTAAPNTPVLNTPADLSNTSDNNITFQWSRTPVAGSAETDSIYIYTNSQLINLEYKNQQTSPYSTSTLSDGTYYWYVKSFDEAGNSSQQSSVFSFTLN